MERTRDDGDARALRLRLSGEGQLVAGQLDQAREAKFAALLDAIPSGERDTVLRALEILTGALRG